MLANNDASTAWMVPLSNLLHVPGESPKEYINLISSSSESSEFSSSSSGESYSSSCSSSETEQDEEKPYYIVSVDPGRSHCAVVKYDAANDIFTVAGLLDLMCRCQVSVASTPWTTTKKRKKKEKPPTVHDMARQTAGLVNGATRDESLKLFKQNDLLVLERQLPDNTAMMIVVGALEICYGPMASQGTKVLSPQANKKFWNQVAVATGTTPCFRKSGGHSKHKTDAKRMAARILSPYEQSLFRRAAERNALHKLHCPVHQNLETQRARKRQKNGQGAKKKRKNGLDLKTDDLMDAMLQAIYAAYLIAAIKPNDPEGAAFQRLKHTKQKYLL